MAAARQMRATMPPAERMLWQALKGERLASLKFRRQHPMGPYVLDFFCAACKLVVEVDGDVHHHQTAYDAARTDHLTAYGYRVLRFRNDEVLTDLRSVLSRIVLVASADRDASLSAPPSPRIGRGAGGEGEGSGGRG